MTDLQAERYILRRMHEKKIFDSALPKYPPQLRKLCFDIKADEQYDRCIENLADQGLIVLHKKLHENYGYYTRPNSLAAHRRTRFHLDSEKAKEVRSWISLALAILGVVLSIIALAR